MTSKAPKVSIGLPVRNGEKFIRRAIDSVLAQTLEDVEVVISDNASTDGTPEICRDYARRDPRVRYHQNEQDIGILRNFNQLVGLARGEYFRWLGSDDWLEPEYAAECAAALDANPHCIAVSTFQVHVDDSGASAYREYRGPRVDSDRPHERFSRMLWFLRQEHWLLDPNFSMFRRDVLAKTHLHRPMPRNDRILAAELSLLGPYCHVDRCLSNRRRTYETLDEVDRKIRPPGDANFDVTVWHRFRVLASVVRDADLTPYQTAYCMAAAFRYYLTDLRYESRRRLRARLVPAAQRLGLTRNNLRRLTGRGEIRE